MPDLSSCVLCGRPVDDEGVARSFGGLETTVHESCAREGLEGKELASAGAGSPEVGSDDEPAGPGDDASGDGDAGAVEDGPDRSAGRGARGNGGPEGAREDERAGSSEEAREAASSPGHGGGDPDWTRITDFT